VIRVNNLPVCDRSEFIYYYMHIYKLYFIYSLQKIRKDYIHGEVKCTLFLISRFCYKISVECAGLRGDATALCARRSQQTDCHRSGEEKCDIFGDSHKKKSRCERETSFGDTWKNL